MKRVAIVFGVFPIVLPLATEGHTVIVGVDTPIFNKRSVEFGGVSSAKSLHRGSELLADVMVQIDCARTYNSDLKLPSVPSVTAPQHVEQTLRNNQGGDRRVTFCSVVRAAGAGRVYISTRPVSRLRVGGAPSDYAVRMLCRLII